MLTFIGIALVLVIAVFLCRNEAGYVQHTGLIQRHKPIGILYGTRSYIVRQLKPKRGQDEKRSDSYCNCGSLVHA